jgi:hypothetical protein
MSFIDELEKITSAYSQSEESAITQQETSTDTQIENPETPGNWFTTAAESQDYQALNQEIESDRNTSKVYIAVGSGASAIGFNSCLGNAVLETTYNPTGYMFFSGVVAVAIISAGLSGSRVNGKTFYSSPWLLSSVGASVGVVSGAYGVSRPYFQDRDVASKAQEKIASQIREVEVKPQQPNNFDLLGVGLNIAAVIGIVWLLKKALDK